MDAKKIISLGFVCLILPYGLSAKSDEDIDRVMKQSGANISSVKTGDEADVKKSSSTVYNYQEVVYQTISNNEQQNSRIEQSKTDTNFAYSNINAEKKRLQELAALAKQDIKTQKEKKEQDETPLFLTGYCYVDNDILIERLPTYAYANCDFPNPYGKRVLAMTITPDFYSKAAIATPLYIEDEDKRLPVISGAVLTKDRSSINIANLVNDRKIEKIMTTAIYSTTQTATKVAQQYLAMKQQAATQTTQDTIATPSGTTTVSATNTKEIPLSNYIVSGSIELVSSLSKVIGEAMINELPFTFKVYKDSILFVDLQMTGDSNIIGYKVVNQNGDKGFIQKQPQFSLEGTQESAEPVNIETRKIKK